MGIIRYVVLVCVVPESPDLSDLRPTQGEVDNGDNEGIRSFFRDGTIKLGEYICEMVGSFLGIKLLHSHKKRDNLWTK